MAHHFVVYRRTWRGSIITRFLSPLFFLLSMGLGLGALVDDSAGGVDGLPYLQFVVPGILAMQAMMTAFGESTYAVMGYIKWNQMYAAMLATPLRVVEVLGGHLAVVAFHLFTGSLIFVLVSAPFGAFASWWVVRACRSPCSPASPSPSPSSPWPHGWRTTAGSASCSGSS